MCAVKECETQAACEEMHYRCHNACSRVKAKRCVCVCEPLLSFDCVCVCVSVSLRQVSD